MLKWVSVDSLSATQKMQTFMNSKLPTGQIQPKSQILFQNKSPPQDINRSTLDLRGEMLPSEPINEAEVLEEEQENLIENGRQLNIQYEPIKEIYEGRKIISFKF